MAWELPDWDNLGASFKAKAEYVPLVADSADASFENSDYRIPAWDSADASFQGRATYSPQATDEADASFEPAPPAPPEPPDPEEDWDNLLITGLYPGHQNAARTATGLKARQQAALLTASRAHAPQQQAKPLERALWLAHTESDKLSTKARLPHTQGIPIDSGIKARHQEAIHLRDGCRGEYQNAIRLERDLGFRHQDSLKTRHHLGQHWQNALRTFNGLGVGVRNAIRTATRSYHPWQQAMGLIHGQFYYHPPSFSWRITLRCDGYPYFPRNLDCDTLLGYGYPEQPDCPICYRRTWGHLGHVTSFKDRQPYSPQPANNASIGATRWECAWKPEPPPDYTVPIREVYFVSNSFTLLRASDNEPIPTRQFSASLDVDSWGWQWQATIPGSAMALVKPVGGDPIEVIATLNSTPLRLVVESLRRERHFPESWLTISGRSRAAWLADPYSAVREYSQPLERTSQQLMEEALTINGVPIGWTVDWQITAWTVPGDTWSFQGTPIEAVARIAEAAGAYIQSHDTAKTLRVLPRYPAMPKDWGDLTATHSLPEDVIEVESIDWADKAKYNAVWIAGGENGRLDRVRIEGTDGALPAPMVVDPLNTHTDASRQRGISILGDTGRQALFSLRLPILPETGIIKPGHILDYTMNHVTTRGLVRSVAVEYQWPEAWQTIGVETHG